MEELKNKLIQACNESGLPLEAIMYVAKDFYRDVVEAWNSAKSQQMNIAPAADDNKEVEEDGQ